MDRRKVVLLFLIGMVVGAIGCYLYLSHQYTEKLQSLNANYLALQDKFNQEKNKSPTIATDTVTKTEIKYLPKEVVVYKDATGNEVTAKEQTDVDLAVSPPNVSMKYNGKDYQLAGIQGETTKFEDGKLVGCVSTNATIDVTDLVNREVNYRLAENEKNISVGGYLTNQGFVASAGVIRNHGNLEYKLIGKVPKIKEFYGAGVEIKF